MLISNPAIRKQYSVSPSQSHAVIPILLYGLMINDQVVVFNVGSDHVMGGMLFLTCVAAE